MAVKSARLELRLSQDQKDLLERAASLAGSTVAGYASAKLMDAATDTISRSTRLVLDEESWSMFLAALDAPDESAEWSRLKDMTPVWDE